MASVVRDEITLLEEEMLQLSVKSFMVVFTGNPTLLCSVWSKKFYNPDSLRAQMKSLWKTRKKFEFKEEGQNLFMIIFYDEKDLDLIMDRRPWFFRRQLIVFERLHSSIERSKL